jgi:hypothetical protein
MPYTTDASATRKSAYKRPHKSRHRRRKDDHKKYDESSDHKFLLKVAGIVGIVLAVALGFAIKGSIERSEANASAMGTPQ